MGQGEGMIAIHWVNGRNSIILIGIDIILNFVKCRLLGFA